MRNDKSKKLLSILRKVVKKGKGGNVAILDVISNALCATMCLFIIASTTQAHPPEAQRRVKGKLIIEFKYVSFRDGLEMPMFILMAPKDAHPSGRYHDTTLYGKDILVLNNSMTSQDTTMYIEMYKQPDSDLTVQMVINNPFMQKYYVGLLYTNHTKFDCEPIPMTVTVKAYFVDGLTKTPYKSEQFVLKYPSNYSFVEVLPPILQDIDL